VSRSSRHEAKNPANRNHRTSGADYLHLSNVWIRRTCSSIGQYWHPEPKDPRTRRRRPHVPSSKPTMSKNPPTQTTGQQSSPNPSTGEHASVPMWRPNKLTSHSSGDPVGGGAYMEAVPARQTLFADLWQFSEKAPARHPRAG